MSFGVIRSFVELIRRSGNSLTQDNFAFAARILRQVLNWKEAAKHRQTFFQLQNWLACCQHGKSVAMESVLEGEKGELFSTRDSDDRAYSSIWVNSFLVEYKYFNPITSEILEQQKLIHFNEGVLNYLYATSLGHWYKCYMNANKRRRKNFAQAFTADDPNGSSNISNQQFFHYLPPPVFFGTDQLVTSNSSSVYSAFSQISKVLKPNITSELPQSKKKRMEVNDLSGNEEQPIATPSNATAVAGVAHSANTGTGATNIINSKEIEIISSGNDEVMIIEEGSTYFSTSKFPKSPLNRQWEQPGFYLRGGHSNVNWKGSRSEFTLLSYNLLCQSTTV